MRIIFLIIGERLWLSCGGKDHMRKIGLLPRIIAALSFLLPTSLSCLFYSTFMFHLFNQHLLRAYFVSDTDLSPHTGVNSTSMCGVLLKEWPNTWYKRAQFRCAWPIFSTNMKGTVGCPLLTPDMSETAQGILKTFAWRDLVSAIHSAPQAGLAPSQGSVE